MSHEHSAQDPLEFVRSMWSNMGFSLPGMVTPTLDVDELDKRIADLKAVEGWLKMNLNMLQMTTQGLEIQRAAIAAVKAMSQHAKEGAAEGEGNPFAAAAMWPWNFMNAQAAQAGAQPAAGAAPATAREDAARG
ncbi:PhaM family polyhydroxyalkanoate granule multifunctional regulatory protein [Azoarcus olearius]|uniref:Uncharacterized protein n=1 Tax=Azoarcus sp. (strain BH72) TaxID=418699 RepID=A1KB49_AZOSB|nr:PhaM family polyhydroxyalkanoate granule multifunctional regulatory protein [Azoarcus olearius]ANQ86599.1 hypothetical protein dqs_3582 [Azoarcus olearius]CAL96055.1 conserved hypothetical protein [Azoarcus olearius]